MKNSGKNNNFIYESKIGFLFPFKDTAVVLAFIYALLFLFFIFLEKGITKVSFLIPLLILSAVSSIVILFLLSAFIWEFLSSPYKIFAADNYMTCKFLLRKSVRVNIDDILYVKRHKGHSKYGGPYYKNKYTLFFENRKKFTVGFFIFRNSSNSLEYIFTSVNRSCNERYIRYLTKNNNRFYAEYNNDKYCFSVLRSGLLIFIDIVLLFLTIFLVIHKIFFPGIIIFAACAVIPAVPVKIIMDISEKNVILKSAFGFKIQKIFNSDIKKIIINNTFTIAVTAVSEESRKKPKTFCLSFYKSKDREKIFEILHIIFKDRISFELKGDELLTDFRKPGISKSSDN